MIQKYSTAPQWQSRGYLPHFQQPGSLQFITYRTADSLPRQYVHKVLQRIPASHAEERRQALEELLARCLGSCPLRNPVAAAIVQGNLLHHDGVKYRLLAWCVMANHVHVLIEVFEDFPLGKVLHSWKPFTAIQINALLGRSGTFWEREYFDRAMRDDEHLRRTIEYIENNPVICGICKRPEDYAFSSARWRMEGQRFAL